MDDVLEGQDISKNIEKRLRSFRENDALREAFITDLVEQYLGLKAQYEIQSDNYENEAQSRQEWQRRCKEKERELNAMRNTIDTKPFVVALIDGDGAPFVDDILRSGLNGGEMAAGRLQAEIKNYVERTFEHSAGADWSIMVQIFANLDGMSRKLYACGKSDGNADFMRIIQDFNSTAPLFSFIDVGQGKERADNRMREMFRFFYGNPSCKHIIFGGCHDTGYNNTLRQYKHDPAAFSKISLLETIPAHSVYREFDGFKMIRFPSVFRPDPLPDKPAPAPAATPSNVVPAATRPVAPPHIPQAPQAMPKVPNPPVSPTIKTTTPHPRQVTPHTDQASNRSVTPPDGTFTSPSWATVGKNGAVQNSYPIGPAKTAPASRFIFLNEREERIDRPLPIIPKVDQQALWDRINKSGKVCNEHFLRGYCDKGGYCPFSHEGKLPPSQLKALAFRARTLACSNGSSCRDFDCYMGHHCMVDDCGRENCNWSPWHNMNKRVVYKYMEDGSIVDYTEKQPYPGH